MFLICRMTNDPYRVIENIFRTYLGQYSTSLGINKYYQSSRCYSEKPEVCHNMLVATEFTLNSTGKAFISYQYNTHVDKVLFCRLFLPLNICSYFYWLEAPCPSSQLRKGPEELGASLVNNKCPYKHTHVHSTRLPSHLSSACTF